MSQFVNVGDYCANRSCKDHGKLHAGNIVKFGKSAQGKQRYQCKVCRSTFIETKGSIFYGLHTPESKVIEVLVLLSEGVRISSISRATGHKADTILSWLRLAASHAALIEEILLSEYQLKRGQIDALWSYVGNRGKKRLPGK